MFILVAPESSSRHFTTATAGRQQASKPTVPPIARLGQAQGEYKAQKKKPKRRVQFDAEATLSPLFQLPFSIASRYTLVFTPPFLKHDFYGLIFDPKVGEMEGKPAEEDNTSASDDSD